MNSLWDEQKKAIFPKGPSRELIDKCGPTVEVPGGWEYEADSEVEYSEDDKDDTIEIENSSSSNDSAESPARSRSTMRKNEAKPAKKA